MLDKILSENRKPVLLLGCGNPARGDDGLGPRCVEMMQSGNELLQIDTIIDYQLQVEHALDLMNRRQIIFIDATVSSTAPFVFTKVQPARDHSYTSHAMSPAAVLAVYEQICEFALPAANILSIRGYDYELGTPISARASSNLHQAVNFLQQLLDGFAAQVASQ